MELYQIKGQAKRLPGEMDLNFRLTSHDNGKNYLLKISYPDPDEGFMAFQEAIYDHLAASKILNARPTLLYAPDGRRHCTFRDDERKNRVAKLMSWIPGIEILKVQPKSKELLYNLGAEAGKVIQALEHFDHPFAHRAFRWDLSQGAWTFAYTSFFETKEQVLIRYFQDGFTAILPKLNDARKGVIHGDLNSNNILASIDNKDPNKVAIIDYGDAIHTALINDLAIALTDTMLGSPEPLEKAKWLIMGYHKHFPLLEDEIKLLYQLIGMRLVIILVQFVIYPIEPGKECLFTLKKQAWELLFYWRNLEEETAFSFFKEAALG